MPATAVSANVNSTDIFLADSTHLAFGVDGSGNAKSHIVFNGTNLVLDANSDALSGGAVFIPSGSKLGVDIATPRTKFQVQGDVMLGDDLGSAGTGDLKLYRGSGVRPLIRLYDSTNDSFIEGGPSLRFGTFAGSGTTVDMELDSNGNIVLSGGYFQSGSGSFSVGVGGGTQVLSAFNPGTYLFSLNVTGINIETNVTAIIQVAPNLTVGISQLSNFNYLNNLAVALQAQDNAAQWGFDLARERVMQIVITNSIGNVANATWRLLRTR